MKLPWYVKSFYDKEKDCYFLKVNKWWAFYSLFKNYLFRRWIRTNSYIYDWKALTGDIPIENTAKYWSTPDMKDLEDFTNIK